MNNLKYKVVEIFRSISGESMNSGHIAVFVRFYGCNLRCKYSESGCDTPYGYEGGKYTEMTKEEIMEQCFQLSPNGHIILTGGEPLIQEGIEELIASLVFDNFTVEIETNGSIDVRDVIDKVEKLTAVDSSQLQFTIDYKCPVSGMTDKMLSVRQFSEMVVETMMRNVAAVKFVVATSEDLKVASTIVESIMKEYSNTEEPFVGPVLTDKLFISPVFGADVPTIVDYMADDNNLCWCRLQLQIHKYIWDPDKRGV